MGYLLEGRWHRGRCDNYDGAFVRQPSTFRESISAEGRYPPAARRYRLYVSPACPWASRAIMVRKLKKLEAAVPMTVVHPDMLENGWTFGGEIDAVTGRRFLYEIGVPLRTARVAVDVSPHDLLVIRRARYGAWKS